MCCGPRQDKWSWMDSRVADGYGVDSGVVGGHGTDGHRG